MPANTPLGGKLISRIAPDSGALKAEAETLPALTLPAAEVWDLKLIATGGYSPLTGFVAQADYDSIISRGRLIDGTPWAVPITLSAPDSAKEQFKPGDRAALRDEAGNLLGAISVKLLYPRRFEEEAKGVFQTTDEAHPGVARIKAAGQTLVAGDVDVLAEALPADEQGMIYRPADVRAEIDKRGWKTVVAFQTRNPIHRAHEYLLRTALETADGLLIHPLVGETKSDDIPADVRTKCYRTLIEKYFPADRVILAALPAPMRYAGPKEAIHHALMRRNYGATHFIVGRDHAGVGNYYGTYDAQKIFNEFDIPKDIGITPLNFEHSSWCKVCEGMVSAKTCPHGPETKVFLSGTKVRDMLKAGQRPPMEFSRPEVADLLIQWAQSAK
jgi:sulfate adenylyltransferase